MRTKTFRSIVAIVVLVATITAFIWYFKRHPEILDSLKLVPVTTIVALFILYTLFLGTLIWIQRATLSLCDIALGAKESTLLVMYSSVINFFGPLQSGPAFRAAYLKSRHNLHIKRYAGATLAYYGIYAAFSGILLLAFAIGWWILVGGAVLIIFAPLLFRLQRFQGLNKKHLRSLALATLCQVLVTSVIYFVEIHALVPNVSYLQALAYTGAANFALFVSITPGAIGFRETFLLFSQKLHDVSSEVIALASVLDRSVYIVFLLILAIIVTAMHATDYFKVKEKA